MVGALFEMYKWSFCPEIGFCSPLIADSILTSEGTVLLYWC